MEDPGRGLFSMNIDTNTHSFRRLCLDSKEADREDQPDPASDSAPNDIDINRFVDDGNPIPSDESEPQPRLASTDHR